MCLVAILHPLLSSFSGLASITIFVMPNHVKGLQSPFRPASFVTKLELSPWPESKQSIAMGQLGDSLFECC
jgi:hypothetical protein